jgi:hypothetical protein
MIGYGPRWNDVIHEMFDNQVGTSVDYPNLYRHRHGKDAADYDRILTENIREARAAGIEVRAIAVPNAETLAIGAERFYGYFVDTLGIRSFQVNTPFPGGSVNSAKRELPLDSGALTRFFVDLAEVWLARGDRDGVRVGPFDELLSVFLDAPSVLPCIWTDDCANHILCIDARGNVAQCDCWVASYPDYWFGNLFEADSLDTCSPRIRCASVSTGVRWPWSRATASTAIIWPSVMAAARCGPSRCTAPCSRKTLTASSIDPCSGTWPLPPRDWHGMRRSNDPTRPLYASSRAHP